MHAATARAISVTLARLQRRGGWSYRLDPCTNAAASRPYGWAGTQAEPGAADLPGVEAMLMEARRDVAQRLQ